MNPRRYAFLFRLLELAVSRGDRAAVLMIRARIVGAGS